MKRTERRLPGSIRPGINCQQLGEYWMGKTDGMLFVSGVALSVSSSCYQLYDYFLKSQAFFYLFLQQLLEILKQKYGSAILILINSEKRLISEKNHPLVGNWILFVYFQKNLHINKINLSPFHGMISVNRSAEKPYIKKKYLSQYHKIKNILWFLIKSIIQAKNLSPFHQQYFIRIFFEGSHNSRKKSTAFSPIESHSDNL